MKTQAYRHGEILLKKVESLPKDVQASKSNIIMVGSRGNSHTIDKGELYFKKESDFIFGYLVAKDTSLLHPEHSPKKGTAKIEDGIYQLIKQQEYTPSGLVPVID